MIEVSEVLLLESSAEDTQKWNNNKKGERSKKPSCEQTVI